MGKKKAFTKTDYIAAAAKATSPVLGIRAMRNRLSQEKPAFRSAVELEEEAERFCRDLRASLRQLRTERKLDQAVLAKQLDMTQSAVSKIETGTGDIGLKTAFRYAQALGLRPVCIFVPSAEQIMKDAPPDRPGAESHFMTPRAATVFAKEQEKLVRSMSDQLSLAVNRIARAVDD